jgi:hypothetical protein
VLEFLPFGETRTTIDTAALNQPGDEGCAYDRRKPALQRLTQRQMRRPGLRQSRRNHRPGGPNARPARLLKYHLALEQSLELRVSLAACGPTPHIKHATTRRLLLLARYRTRSDPPCFNPSGQMNPA